MSDKPEIGDEEIILRHVPGGTMFQAPGPRVSSANFKLRSQKGELGISVTRLKITGPVQLLAGVRMTAGSKVAAARVGDIRALGFKVVSAPIPHDLGHSEIQSGDVSLESDVDRRRLAKIFQFVELPPTSTE